VLDRNKGEEGYTHQVALNLRSHQYSNDEILTSGNQKQSLFYLKSNMSNLKAWPAGDFPTQPESYPQIRNPNPP
ncbi:unnamed protein product, partial [Allacma fusca]